MAGGGPAERLFWFLVQHEGLVSKRRDRRLEEVQIEVVGVEGGRFKKNLAPAPRQGEQVWLERGGQGSFHAIFLGQGGFLEGGIGGFFFWGFNERSDRLARWRV
jgi:hypothetical protein